MPQSVVLKIDQAKKHLDTLEKEVRSFLSRNPFAVVSEEEPRTGDLVDKVRINESVPIHWSAIVGDIINNLRSALDHLAYELVQANDQPTTRDTAFPISDNEAKFKANFPQALDGASMTAISTIQSLKPYKGGNDDLWRLHQLDIIDKHRAIVTIGVAYEHLIMNVEFGNHIIPMKVPLYSIIHALEPTDRRYPIEDGLEVFRLDAATRVSFNVKSLVSG
jgi:hypothetical protein